MFSDVQNRFAIIYTAILMILFCIPSYFAMESTINEEKHKTVHNIIEWIELNKNRIINEDGFNIPGSTRFKTNIYSSKHQILHKEIERNLKSLDFKTDVIYPYIYYQKSIIKNGKLFYLVVESRLNYTKIVFLATTLFLVVLSLIYLMINIFIKSSIYPYERMQKYMNDFFNDSMHELKTPLGVININIDLLDRYNQSSKQLKRIKSATRQMMMTYEDIEYYIKNKKLMYPKEQINISEYLMDRIAIFKEIAISKSIEINHKIEADFFIYMSRVELQRVIDNTISNAIKYSSSESHIDINLKHRDKNSCELNIKDYGQGIKDVYKIFRRFEREDVIKGGFGIGLNIVQNICNKNNIEMDISSCENMGSTFTYIFNLYKNKFLDKVDS